MRKILIVDDQPDIRRLIHLTLGKRYEIHEASNAAEAMVIAAKQKPDAIILDIMMPGNMNGMDVLKQVKADAALKGSFVVMVTAKGQQSDFELAINAGADAYLIKPFSPLQLMALLQEHFGS